MKHEKELSAVFEYVLNGEHEEAAKIFHSIVVETASEIYNGIVEAEEDELGGDETESFMSDVEADADDESAEGEFGDAEGEEEEELSVEDRVEELEDSLEALRAEFDRLLDVEEVEHGEDFDADGEFGGDEFGSDEFGGDDFGGDNNFGKPLESLTMEATNFQDKVKVNMNSEEGNVNKKSTFASGKKFSDSMPGGAHKIGLGGDEKGPGKVSAKDQNAEDNVDVPQKKVSSPDMKEKSGVNTKSTLGETKKKK